MVDYRWEHSQDTPEGMHQDLQIFTNGGKPKT